MRRHFLIFFFSLIAVFSIASQSEAKTTLDRFRGSIVLQVESKGEAWYVEPTKGERWYLGRPDDAFAVMRKLGLGMANINLAKIPRAGSADRGDQKFAKRFLGRILLDVESHGEAWYVAPQDGHRYFLGRPHDAFRVMREVGRGITNTLLEEMTRASSSAVPVVIASQAQTPVPPSSFAQQIPTLPPVVVPEAPPSPSPTPETQPTPQQVETTIAERLLTRINEERTKANVSPLRLIDAVTNVAQAHAEDMARRQYFEPKNPEGEGSIELLKKGGYEPRQAAMLLADGPATADDAFDLWIAKDGRSALLHETFEDVGVGLATSTASRLPRRQWVVILASSQTRYEDRITASLANIDAMRSAQLARLNAERAKENLPSLVLNELLHQSAQKHAEDMLRRDFFEHVNPDGVTPHERILATGYQARISAENLAVGPTTVDQVMTGWMNSPGHRANILFDGIEEVGFGLAIGRNATGFKVYWVQNFGKR